MTLRFALSSVVLALVCAYLAARAARQRPGVAIACGAVGLAAAVGAVRFLGAESATEAHRFFSMIAAVAALPLLAMSIQWSDGRVATDLRAAALLFLACGAAGVALVLGLGLARWAQFMPAVAAAALLGGAIQERAERRIAGAVLLLLAFASISMNLTQIAGLAPIEALYYGLALALFLLCA